jgi:hypothetical protein
MDAALPNEKQLLTDIEQLREQFPQTQDLYREVCTLLFFRYGMTPTGSMSAPAEALGKFWEDLREKSRVRIEHPDLPDALKTAAGELTSALWTSAQTLATSALEALRAEAQATVMEANTSLTSAHLDRDNALRSLEAALAQLDLERASVAKLNQDLAAASAVNGELEAQILRINTDNALLQQSLAEARTDFGAELEKVRAGAQLADERFRALETRSLLEIDRERTAGVKLQKELDSTRAAATLSAERARSEISALQEQLGNLRHNAGVQEGKLLAAIAARDAMVADLRASRAQWSEANTQLTLASADAERWRTDAHELRQTVASLMAKEMKLPRAPRKQKTE